MNGIRAAFGLAVPAFAIAGFASAATAADVTCFSTRSNGIACLDADGKWSTFNRKSGQIKSRRVRDMAVCGGKIFIADGRQVVSWDGAAWSDPNPLPSGFARRIACAPNGYVVATTKAVALWNGEGWKLWQADTMLKDERTKSISDAAVDKDGNVWFVAFGGVAGRIKGSDVKLWKDKQGFPRKMVLSRIFADKDGTIYIPQYRGIYTPDGEGWKMIAGPGANNISQAPDGSLWLARGSRVNRFENNSWKTFRIDHSVRDVAVDETGRVWAATEYGIAVGKDGEWDWRQMHNSDLSDNSLYKVAVLGKGGTLPAKKEQPAGTLKGRLEWRDSGEPVKGVTVQICGISKGLFSSSPCEGRPHAQSTTTDDDGKFAFTDVAPASYRFVAKLGDKWVRILLAYNRAHVAPGQDRNSGTVRVHQRYRK